MTFPLLFDDAALFPPCAMALDDAVHAHRAHREAPYADLVGPLVVGSSHLEALASLGVRDRLDLVAFDLAVVVPGAAGAVAALDTAHRYGLHVVALEVSHTTPDALASTLGEPAGVTTYVELPRGPAAVEAAAALAGTPYRGKIRTGGVEATMHPDERELAATVYALVRAEVAFKATAGLHHALRNTDPVTGFEQHGFVNLLVAAEAAALGADVTEVAGVLAERDARSLPELSALPEHSLLRSVGTCSISDPVNDLLALDLVDRGPFAPLLSTRRVEES